MSTTEKKSFRARLKLDSHHAIERFSLMFAAFAVTLIFITGGAFTSAAQNNASTEAATTVYTPTFTTSKTELKGEVTGLYVSSDHARALVMMKFDEVNGTFSVDADNYQAFLTGSDRNLRPQAPKTDITGQLAVFGTTGYVGVFLDSSLPFEQQILNLTVRANSELVYNEPDQQRELRADLQGQDSFRKFDQWRVFVNPGATDAIETEALDGRELDMSKIYYDLIIAEREQEVRAAMDGQLKALVVDLTKIDEFTKQMSYTDVGGVFIIPPTVPVQIAGDEITGEPGTDDTESTLELDTDWVIPSGYDFDWRDGTVEEGYLNDIVPADESYVTYLSTKAKLGDVHEDEDDFQPTRLTWMLTDGKDLGKDYSSSADAERMRQLIDLKDNLVQAYRDYYTHKTEYQTDGFGQLLDLEIELRSADSGVTVNNGDEALVIW